MLTFLFNEENAALTSEQRVAKWQFIIMDINHDKVRGTKSGQDIKDIMQW